MLRYEINDAEYIEMTDKCFKPKAYVLLGCPFCFKFLLFMTEAGLLDHIEIVSFDPSADDFEAKKENLVALADKKVTYPTVEVEPKVYKSETDDLINYFADQNAISDMNLPTLKCYQEGLMARYINLYMENIELKKKIEG